MDERDDLYSPILTRSDDIDSCTAHGAVFAATFILRA